MLLRPHPVTDRESPGDGPRQPHGTERQPRRRVRQVAAIVLAAALAALAAPRPATATPVATPHVKADLISEVETIRPTTPFWLGLRLQMEPGWHTYWVNPGDSGLATEIEWSLPDGFEAGEIQWPYPERMVAPPFVSYGYENEVLLLTEITPPGDLEPGDTATLSAHASWTVCREDRCIPSDADLSITLPVAQGPPASDRFTAPYFEAGRMKLPQPVDSWDVAAATDDEVVVLTLTPNGEARDPGAVTVFEKLRHSLIDHGVPARMVHKDGRIYVQLTVKKRKTKAPTHIEGVLVSEHGWDAEGRVKALPFAVDVEHGKLPELPAAGVVQPQSPSGSAGRSQSRREGAALPHHPSEAGGVATKTRAHGLGLALSLLFAFLGGVILNLMPCVFPVLSLKVVGFVESAGGDRRHGRLHAVAFAAGVLLFFWLLAGMLLALRAGGQQLGWGFQLQSPLFVAGLAMLVFALALNMAGLFELGTSVASLTGRAEQAPGYLGSFSSGALATVLATPCTAPFMGSALGYALTQSPIEAFLVFTALGVGMACPYVTLATSPALLRLLPRPGAWMETFKQAMSFPLFATVLWLVWVFGRQVGNDGVARLLGAMLVIGAAAWVLGRWGDIATAPGKRRAASVASLLLLAAAIALAVDASGLERSSTEALAAAEGTTASAWLPYDRDEVARLRAAGKPVFIDFTAAWCLTCQVNERVAFTPAVDRRLRELGVVTMKADWTSRDPRITAALEALGRDGVPLYVLYRPEHPEPTILPQILSPGVVLDALDTLHPREADAG
jgi:thiol:disulfide interchange protein